MKRTLLPAALVLTLGASIALAQAPIERQSPDSQTTAAAPQTSAPSQDQSMPAAPAKAHHAKDPNKEAAKLAKELNLTPDQQAKLAGAFADRDQKTSALQANTSLDPQDMKKQMRGIHKDSEAQVATILTPDQLQQMKDMPKGGKHGGAAPPPAAAPSTPPSN